MRVFETLKEAGLEIHRELYKSPLVDVTRVQQREGLDIQARERLGFTYSVIGGWPDTPRELTWLAAELGMTAWIKDADAYERWLEHEVGIRLGAFDTYWQDEPNEKRHPALQTTIEGNWPSYTYQERLFGALEQLSVILAKNPDSRRAFWPIFRPEDTLRAMAPTRVPCSLGYEAMIRKVGDDNHLMLFYLMRSVDYDTFWLSDIWLARQFQLSLLDRLNVTDPELKLKAGQVVQHILSFHSFFAANTEVY
jgi:thymidylate synthase